MTEFRPVDAPVGCAEVSLGLGTDIFSAGVNGALHRTPPVDAASLSLLERIQLNPEWKARRPKIETFGITFPEGVVLLPPKPPAGERKETLRRLDPPATPEAELDPHVGLPKPPKRTKLRPPEDALSLQDRLFYLLQPPLESWLAGQELVMPFEPFPVPIRRHRLALFAEVGPVGRRNGPGQDDAVDHGHSPVDAKRPGAPRAAGLPQTADPQLDSASSSSGPRSCRS